MKIVLPRTRAIVTATIVIALISGGGCRSNVGRAINELKELEPKAKQRNEEIRKMTGVPEEKGE